MNNSEVAEIVMFIYELEKSYEERQERNTNQNDEVDEEHGSIVYSDIYRRAMLAEFLRGK